MRSFSVLCLVLPALFGLSLADLGNSNPPSGSCLCVTASRLNLRSGAGTRYRVVTTVNRGQCFTYRNQKRSADGYYWYSLNYNGQTVWAAGKYLRLGSSSQCSSGGGGGSCSAHGGPFNQACLDCICQVESNCRPVGCRWDVNSNSCGYYQIKNPYYQDCGSPGSSWQTCANDKTCATRCVRNYINRYYRTCTGSSSPKCCEQAARMHNGGPAGCRRSATISYWNKVKACLARRGK